MNRLVEYFARRRGTRAVDITIRLTGAIGVIVAGLVIAMPELAPMAGFFLVTLFVNGPLGPFLPSAYEPVVILMGRLNGPWPVATVGITGIILVDWLDYYLYRAVLHHPLLESPRRSWLVRSTVRLFERAPFLATFVGGTGILPHVVIRFLAPLSGYSVRRYLLATFLGRAPRLWLLAALGTLLPVTDRILGLSVAGTIVLGLVMMVHRLARPARPATAADIAPGA